MRHLCTGGAQRRARDCNQDSVAVVRDVSRATDRRHAVARLAMLGLAIAVAFAAVSLAGVSPSEGQRWSPAPDPPGRGVRAAAGALGLALFPGHVTATVAGMLFGAVAGTALALAATLLAAGLSWRRGGSARTRSCRCSALAAGAGTPG